MLILMTAALVAAQPAPAANPHAQHAQMAQVQMAPVQQQKHDAMKKECCCKNMGKGDHDRHAPGSQPQGRSGQ